MRFLRRRNTEDMSDDNDGATLRSVSSRSRRRGLHVMERHRRKQQKQRLFLQNTQPDQMSIHDSCSELQYQMDYCNKMHRHIKTKQQQEIIDTSNELRRQRAEVAALKQALIDKAIAEEANAIDDSLRHPEDAEDDHGSIKTKGTFLSTLTTPFSCDSMPTSLCASSTEVMDESMAVHGSKAKNSNLRRNKSIIYNSNTMDMSGRTNTTAAAASAAAAATPDPMQQQFLRQLHQQQAKHERLVHLYEQQQQQHQRDDGQVLDRSSVMAKRRPKKKNARVRIRLDPDTGEF